MTSEKRKKLIDWMLVFALSFTLGYEMGTNQWIKAVEDALFLTSYLLCMKTYQECDMYRQYWKASMDIIEALEKRKKEGEEDNNDRPMDETA